MASIEQPKPKRKIVWLFIKIFVSLALLSVVFYSININDLLAHLQKISVSIFVYWLLLNIGIMILKSYRWKLLVSVYDPSISYPMVFWMFIRSFFYGLITPGRLGEFIKIKYLTDTCKQITLSQSTATVLIDRLFDFVLLFILGSLGLLVFFIQLFNTIQIPMAVFFVMGILIVAVILIFIFHKSLHRILSRIKGYPKLFGFIKDLFTHLQQFSWKQLLIPLLLTVLSSVLIGLQLYVIILDLDLSTQYDYFQSLFTIALANMIALLPITISGFGTREGVYILLFSSVGITQATAISISLLTYTGQYLMNFPILLILVPFMNWTSFMKKGIKTTSES